MTKKELLKALSDRHTDAINKYAAAPLDSPEELAANMVMKAWSSALDLVAGSEPEQEPESPKKARRINLMNRDGYWYWEVWREEEPGSWGRVFSMTMGYASIAEAANLAKQWMEKNP